MRRFLFAFGPLFIVACASSSSSSSSDGGGGGFIGHAPINHVSTAVTCASHADAGVTEPCTRASDCPAGQACLCGDDLPGNAAFKANQCVASTCITDRDCGSTGYCSKSITPMCASGVSGFFCHTPNDSCSDDTDCKATNGACTWSGSSWGCVTAKCAG